jgi:hypothetical protein
VGAQRHSISHSICQHMPAYVSIRWSRRCARTATDQRRRASCRLSTDERVIC